MVLYYNYPGIIPDDLKKEYRQSMKTTLSPSTQIKREKPINLQTQQQLELQKLWCCGTYLQSAKVVKNFFLFFYF